MDRCQLGLDLLQTLGNRFRQFIGVGIAFLNLLDSARNVSTLAISSSAIWRFITRSDQVELITMPTAAKRKGMAVNSPTSAEPPLPAKRETIKTGDPEEIGNDQPDHRAVHQRCPVASARWRMVQ